jgi:hypothetical protein
MIGMAYLAGDVRGRRIEYAKCEAAAKAAQQAADAQDLQAAKDANSDAAQVMDELKKQKEASDAKLAELQQRLATASVPVGAPCLYGDGDMPASAPAGSVRGNDGTGAGNPKYPGPARLPQPRPKAAGHQGD